MNRSIFQDAQYIGWVSQISGKKVYMYGIAMYNELPSMIGGGYSQTTSGETRIVWIICPLLAGMIITAMTSLGLYVNTTNNFLWNLRPAMIFVYASLESVCVCVLRVHLAPVNHKHYMWYLNIVGEINKSTFLPLTFYLSNMFYKDIFNIWIDL